MDTDGSRRSRVNEAQRGFIIDKKKNPLEPRVLVFTFPIKRESTKCHIVVVQQRQRNVQKSVPHVQSCCFASLNLLFFCRFRCRRRRRCLSSLSLLLKTRRRMTTAITFSRKMALVHARALLRKSRTRRRSRLQRI